MFACLNFNLIILTCCCLTFLHSLLPVWLCFHYLHFFQHCQWCWCGCEGKWYWPWFNLMWNLCSTLQYTHGLLNWRLHDFIPYLKIICRWKMYRFWRIGLVKFILQSSTQLILGNVKARHWSHVLKPTITMCCWSQNQNNIDLVISYFIMGEILPAAEVQKKPTAKRMMALTSCCFIYKSNIRLDLSILYLHTN